MGSADLFGHCRDAHDRVLFGHRGGGTDLELAPIGTGSRRQHWRAGSRHGRSGDAASTAALPIGASSKRIVDALQPRVCAALKAIADENADVYNARFAVPLRKTSAFEWLVRYQVLGESQRKISYSLAEQKWGHE